MRRFGEIRTYKHGERLFETGKPGPGMFVVLSGHVAITQRDGLGHVTPVIDQGPGQFLAEIGQLSGRVALVDGHAEGDVETLLIPPERLRALLVAEADLGERIMRALILRRVNLIQGGVGGPVLIGPSNSSGVVRLQGFLTRNGFPHHLLDPERRSRCRRTDRALFAVAVGLAAGGGRRRHRASQSGRNRTRPRARHDRRSGRRQGLRCRHRRLRSGRTRDRGVRGVRRALGGGAGYARVRRAGRRQRAHRELSRLPDRNLGPGACRPRLQPGAEVRRRHHDSGCGEGARLRADRRRLCADARRRRDVACARRRGGERRALPAARDRKSRSTSRAAASGTGHRRSRRGCAPNRKSCWSAAAIPQARPRCFCRAMPAGSTW